MIYEAIASLPGAHVYDDYIMVVCPFHGGEKPNMMVSKRTGKAYCMGEQRFYDMTETYTQLLVSPAPVVDPGPSYPTTLLPVKAGSWVQQELAWRRIVNYDRLRMDKSGQVLAFLNAANKVQAYRFGEGVGYRTVGSDPLWTQQNIGNAFLGTIVVYGMLDAAAVVPAVGSLGMLVVTPTRGQTASPGPFSGLPAPIYVWPDRYEEKSAIRLLSRLGWRAGGMIEPLPDYKDPSEVIAHYGHDWVTAFIASYVLSDWSHCGETEARNSTQYAPVLAGGQ